MAPEYALLHRLYLTAPLQQNVLGGQAHWAAFGDALKDAGKGAREVFKLCGGCEEHVARRARGLAATAKSEAKNVPGTPDFLSRSTLVSVCSSFLYSCSVQSSLRRRIPRFFVL